MTYVEVSRPLDRVMVTGVNGFVGPHLARVLHEAGCEVVGVGKDQAPSAAAAQWLADYKMCDLLYGWPNLSQIDAVVHLAGLSAVGASFLEPQAYISGNSSMLTHLGEAILSSDARPRVLVASSGAVYDSEQSMPIREDGTTAATSPYVVSKLLVESQAAYYARRGVDMIVARPFNHLGPGQGEGFLLPDLLRRIRNASATGVPLLVGNLNTRRDYTDVRDVAEAYKALITANIGENRLFNICSGTSTTGTRMLRWLLDAMGVADLEINVDQSLIRPNDPPRICGDASRLRACTGWAPKRRLVQTVTDFAIEAGRVG